MSAKWKAAARSFITTFVATFLAAVPVAAAVQGDFTWVEVAVASALVAGLRTVLAALDPAMPLFGLSGDKPGQ